jgi:hypothetical protein
MCTRGMFADPEESDGEGTLSGIDEGLKFEMEDRLERHMMIIKSLQLSKVETIPNITYHLNIHPTINLT